MGVSRGGLLARMAYLAVLALATLSPFELDAAPAALLASLQDALDLRYTARHVVDAARNIVLFAGWGALWVATSPQGGRHASVGIPLLTGFLLSVAAESIQLAMPARTTSPIDVLTNTAGAGLGALAVTAAVDRATALRGRRSYVGLPAAVFLGSYLAAAAMEALLPLMLEPVPGAWGGPLRRTAASLGAFRIDSILTLPLTDFLLLLPVGAFAVAALREAGASHSLAVRRTAAWGGMLSVLAEVAHAPLGLPVRLGPVAVHAAAIALGALAAGHLLPAFTRGLRGRARPAALLAGYAVVLTFWMWRPFMPVTQTAALVTQLSPERLIPLHSLAARVDLYSVADVGKSFFLCLPLGALLAVWPLRRRGPLGGALPGLYLVAGLEAGQLLLIARFFDVSDILVQGAAVGIGWVVMRNAGYGVYGALWSADAPVQDAAARDATAPPASAPGPPPRVRGRAG